MERLPSVQHIRNRIENIKDEDFKYGLMYLFLIAGDIGEAFGKFGPKGEDVKKVAYEFGDTKYEALIFNVHKSSRKDHGRFCVLPYDSYYEPWAESIYDYFQKNRSQALFSNENKKSRTKIRDKTDEIIRVFTDFPCYKKNKRVHFSTICLRDVRIANLRDFYRFRDVDLADRKSVV